MSPANFSVFSASVNVQATDVTYLFTLGHTVPAKCVRLVDPRGLEPLTSALQKQRSTR